LTAAPQRSISAAQLSDTLTHLRNNFTLLWSCSENLYRFILLNRSLWHLILVGHLRSFADADSLQRWKQLCSFITFFRIFWWI